MKSLHVLLTPFKKADAAAFTIDAAQLTASSPEHLPSECAVPLSREGKLFVAALRKDGKVSLHGQSFVAEIEEGAFSVSQRLGGCDGSGRGSAFAHVRFNGHRLLRERLNRRDAFSRDRSPARWSRENYVDPTWLRCPLDLHAESLVDLWEALGTARDLYRQSVWSFFGINLDPSKVIVRISQIELTWDRPCSVASHAPTSLWKSWLDVFRAPGIGGSGEEAAPPKLITATKVATPEIGPGTRVLRGSMAKGDNAKLYAKTSHILRFEVELTKARMRRVLGRSLDHASLAALSRDLETLAAPRFDRLLATQEGVLTRRVQNFGSLFDLFAKSGKPHKVGPILAAFLARKSFHNIGSAYRRELNRLEKRGAACYQGGGLWCATPLLTPTFRALEILERLEMTR
jgi:hypothetical protein